MSHKTDSHQNVARGGDIRIGCRPDTFHCAVLSVTSSPLHQLVTCSLWPPVSSPDPVSLHPSLCSHCLVTPSPSSQLLPRGAGAGGVSAAPVLGHRHQGGHLGRHHVHHVQRYGTRRTAVRQELVRLQQRRLALRVDVPGTEHRSARQSAPHARPPGDDADRRQQGAQQGPSRQGAAPGACRELVVVCVWFTAPCMYWIYI